MAVGVYEELDEQVKILGRRGIDLTDFLKLRDQDPTAGGRLPRIRLRTPEGDCFFWSEEDEATKVSEASEDHIG